MDGFNRREFLSAAGAGMTLPILAQAQGFGRRTLEDVENAAAFIENRTDKSERAYLGGLVEATIRVRKEDSEAALKILEEVIQKERSRIDRYVLTDALVQTCRPGGKLTPSDEVFAAYDNRDAQIKVGRILIREGADAGYRLENASATGFVCVTDHLTFLDNLTLVHAAAEDGNLPLVKLLVEEGHAEPGAVAVWSIRRVTATECSIKTDKNGEYIFRGQPTVIDRQSPVDSAALESQPDIIRYLGAKGVKPVDRFFPSFIYAAVRGDVKTVAALLDIGIRDNVRDGNGKGHTATEYLTGRAKPPKEYDALSKLPRTKEAKEILDLIDHPEKASAPFPPLRGRRDFATLFMRPYNA